MDLGGTDFLLPEYRLVIGRMSGAPDRPWESGLKVYLLSPDLILRMVTRRRDLVGVVAITSADRALRYVRFFTSPATARCLSESWYEVAPASAVDDEFCFGRRNGVSWSWMLKGALELSERDGTIGRLDGVILDGEWEREEFRSPDVETTADGFVVRRTLVHLPWGARSKEAWWVAETVRHNGESRLRKLRRIRVQGDFEFSRPKLR